MDVIIDEANKEQASDIAYLFNYLIMYVAKNTDDPYWELECDWESKNSLYIQSLINDKSKKIFCAIVEREIVGFIFGEITKCHLPISKIKNVGYISAAYVSEKHRKN
jgi:hypothetical protein